MRGDAPVSGGKSRLDQARSRKSVEALQAEASSHGLRRRLGALNIVLLGVGGIIGAGIFVMTGNAAANFAGPAVIFSFLLAGLACGLTALCYAELAAIMPVSGSSYTYCYASLGEVYAWGLAWILIFDYGLAEALIAAGFAGYLSSLLADLDVLLPAALVTPTLEATAREGGFNFAMRESVNLVAAGSVMTAALLLTRGVHTSATVNNILVAIKVSVLAAFIAVGVGAIDPGNWTPFVPANEGGFAFGWEGVVRAASILFFAYLGFETISTASSETRNPQRDMPIGILGALAACTIIYIAVALVLTGVVPFRELSAPDPIAVALDRIGRPNLALVVKAGAVLGLGAVLLVNAYGQSRVCFAMARDGLLPEAFCRLHSKHATPALGVIVLGVLSAAGAAFLPISILGDLISIGTGFAFSVVSFGVIWLRSRRPDLPRPFRVPFGGVRIGGLWLGFVPVAAIVMCWAMILPVIVDLVGQAFAGDILPLSILGCWLMLGAIVYAFYGLRPARRRSGD